jgi:hypothetical protein
MVVHGAKPAQVIVQVVGGNDVLAVVHEGGILAEFEAGDVQLQRGR